MRSSFFVLENLNIGAFELCVSSFFGSNSGSGKKVKFLLINLIND